jgi:hypothetical protein
MARTYAGAKRLNPATTSLDWAAALALPCPALS